MTVSLIWAQAANGVIGHEGTLPWSLPEDLKHFRQQTRGCTVVMGRGTWESLPAKFRPLPGRRNIVLSTQADWQADGASTARSLEEALTDAKGNGTEANSAEANSTEHQVWVIGGASVYAAALIHADRLVVTELQESFDGDAHAPPLGADWRRLGPPPQWEASSTGLHYRIVNYAR